MAICLLNFFVSFFRRRRQRRCRRRYRCRRCKLISSRTVSCGLHPAIWKKCSKLIEKLRELSSLKYSGDLNTGHLYNGNIWIPNFLKFRFQMVRYSNGRSMDYVLCTRPTIQIPDQYISKQDGLHLSIIQMVGLSGIKMACENQTIWHPTSFQPFE